MISGLNVTSTNADHSSAQKPQGEQIAKHFSAAAHHYAKHDSLQRMSRDVLLAHGQFAASVVDIGCGPGTDLSAKGVKHTVGVDIALGMLQQARDQLVGLSPICANAEQLPLADDSVECIYSNLALQWCDNFPSAVNEMARVVRSGGYVNLAIVTDGSLAELQQLGLHVNSFLAFETVTEAFTPSDWHLQWHEQQTLTCYFDDLKQLLYSIKGVGASTHTCGQANAKTKLTGRQSWLALQQSAQQIRVAQGLPLSYQIGFIRAQKR